MIPALFKKKKKDTGLLLNLKANTLFSYASANHAHSGDLSITEAPSRGSAPRRNEILQLFGQGHNSLAHMEISYMCVS